MLLNSIGQKGSSVRSVWGAVGGDNAAGCVGADGRGRVGGVQGDGVGGDGRVHVVQVAGAADGADGNGPAPAGELGGERADAAEHPVHEDEPPVDRAVGEHRPAGIDPVTDSVNDPGGVAVRDHAGVGHRGTEPAAPLLGVAEVDNRPPER